jgi:hypothetical protein
MTWRLGFLISAVFIAALHASAVTAEVSAEALPVPTALDVVTLKDGTVIYGQVLGMVADELHIKTSFGPTAGEDIVKIMWPNVSKISVNRPIPFSLGGGNGTAR